MCTHTRALSGNVLLSTGVGGTSALASSQPHPESRLQVRSVSQALSLAEGHWAVISQKIWQSKPPCLLGFSSQVVWVAHCSLGSMLRERCAPHLPPLAHGTVPQGMRLCYQVLGFRLLKLQVFRKELLPDLSSCVPKRGFRIPALR